MTDSNGPKHVVAADGHTYHKSATANATTAPTNEATVANADKTKDLNADEAQFVTIIDYEWNMRRGDLDPKVIREEYGYSETEFSDLLHSPPVVHQLDQRGVNSKYLKPPVGEPGTTTVKPSAKLTPVQLIVANLMLNLTDNRPPKKKLQDCGVTPTQYQAWLKDPEFQNYMNTVAEGLFTDVQHEAYLSLISKVQAGDQKAIEYYFEITGRYIKQSATNTGGSQQDLQQMIVRIIEIVVDEVDDPNTAARIADRLKGLVMGNQVAGLLATPEPIIQPEIAEARHLTPDQLQAVNKGVGVNE